MPIGIQGKNITIIRSDTLLSRQVWYFDWYCIQLLPLAESGSKHCITEVVYISTDKVVSFTTMLYCLDVSATGGFRCVYGSKLRTET